MTWSAVGGLIQATSATFSLTPGGAGDLILLEVTVPPDSAVICSSAASSNATWTLLASLTGVNVQGTAAVLAGTVTGTGTATVTLTFTGGSPAAIRAGGQEFSSTAGSWALDAHGNEDDASATTDYPTLTPAGAGELYFGYAYNSESSVAGSTSGYVYESDAHSNGLCYNVSCTSSAQTPVWGDSDTRIGIAVLMKETGASSGPVFYPARQAIRARQQPVLAGQVGGTGGGPVRNPGTGPAAFLLQHPARAPVPRNSPRGRTAGSPGGPVRNPAPPSPGPAFRQACGPARARIPGHRGGWVASGTGGPVLNPPPHATYEYLGQEACTYLDYLDLTTGHVLSPVPGNYYNMAVASGRNPYLTVPPPGRPWNPGNPGAGGTFAPLVLSFRAIPPEISHGHYPGAACGHCDPEAPRRPPPPRTTPGPGAAAQDYAAAIARGRAHTSALHAAWARGILRPGEPLTADDHQRLGCCPDPATA